MKRSVGTQQDGFVPSMLRAGKQAEKLRIPKMSESWKGPSLTESHLLQETGPDLPTPKLGSAASSASW